MTARLAALAVAALLLAGCSGEVAFGLEVPQTVRLAPDGAASFRVTGTLSNDTGEAVTLEASTVCQAEDWRVLDADGNVVARPPEVVCIQMLARQELADGEALPLAHQIDIRAGRLRPDREYRLVFEFWGYRAEQAFTTRAADG